MGQSLPEMMLRGAGRSGRDRRGERQPEQRIRRTRRETAQALSVVPLFSGFSKADLNRLAEETDVRVVPRGHHDRRGGAARRDDVRRHVGRGEGDARQPAASVSCGRATSSVRWRCWTARPGRASVVAETPVVAIRLFRRTLLKMLEAEPQLSLKILDSLVRRVRDLCDDLAQRLARQQPFDLRQRPRVQVDVARRGVVARCAPRSGCRRSPT